MMSLSCQLQDPLSDFNDNAKIAVLHVIRKFFRHFLRFFLLICRISTNFVKKIVRKSYNDTAFFNRIPHRVGSEH